MLHTEKLAKQLLGRFEDAVKKKSKSIEKLDIEVQEEQRLAETEANKNHREAMEKIIGNRVDFSQVKPNRYIPFAKNHRSVGRSQELALITSILIFDKSLHAASLPRRCVLHALGWLGKTEIALEFAYQHLAEFDSVFWVAAETSQKALTSFSEFAMKINHPCLKNISDEIKKPDEVLR